MISNRENEKFQKSIILPDDLRKADPYFQGSLLQESIRSGNRELFEWLLLQDGHDFDVVDASSNSLLDICDMTGRLDWWPKILESWERPGEPMPSP